MAEEQEPNTGAAPEEREPNTNAASEEREPNTSAAAGAQSGEGVDEPPQQDGVVMEY